MFFCGVTTLLLLRAKKKLLSLVTFFAWDQSTALKRLLWWACQEFCV